jgi:hypothetical protein
MVFGVTVLTARKHAEDFGAVHRGVIRLAGKTAEDDYDSAHVSRQLPVVAMRHAVL